MKTIGQMQSFLGNGDQHVSADRDPDLRLDRVLVGAIKRLDAQVLLDPFEKQFDLPALAVQVCNQLGLESEIVGQKSYSLSSVVRIFKTSKEPMTDGINVLSFFLQGKLSNLRFPYERFFRPPW